MDFRLARSSVSALDRDQFVRSQPTSADVGIGVVEPRRPTALLLRQAAMRKLSMTSFTPGAAQTADRAASRSAHESTTPLNVTRWPSTSTSIALVSL